MSDEALLIEELLKTGAYPDEIAALIRSQMDSKDGRVTGEPLDPDEALEDWAVTDVDIAQASADWMGTVEDWALTLLDADALPTGSKVIL